MPRDPKAPADAMRFFARIDQFTCECPKCGQLIVVKFGRPVGKIRRYLASRPTPKQQRVHTSLAYNPLTSRLECPQCLRIFGVGLILWPVRPRAAAGQPPDTKPSYRQLLEIRRHLQGFAPFLPITTRDPVNWAVEEPCTCPDGGYLSTCPVHGWVEPSRRTEFTRLVDAQGEPLPDAPRVEEYDDSADLPPPVEEGED